MTPESPATIKNPSRAKVASWDQMNINQVKVLIVKHNDEQLERDRRNDGAIVSIHGNPLIHGNPPYDLQAFPN